MLVPISLLAQPAAGEHDGHLLWSKWDTGWHASECVLRLAYGGFGPAPLSLRPCRCGALVQCFFMRTSTKSSASALLKQLPGSISIGLWAIALILAGFIALHNGRSFSCGV